MLKKTFHFNHWWRLTTWKEKKIIIENNRPLYIFGHGKLSKNNNYQSVKIHVIFLRINTGFFCNSEHTQCESLYVIATVIK